MRSRHTLRTILIAVLLAIGPPSAVAQQQIRAQLVTSGLTHPVEFVQDPSNSAVQYIVEQEGRIRVLNNGSLQGTNFLNLTGGIASGGEQGLLGLAFPTNYGASGRFYVFFTNAAGDLVVSRFRRSAGNPLVADPGSRFDLMWSTNQRWINHPVNTNHNGGHLAFGPDGYLYIAVGDGGGGGDSPNNAQNLDSLLGKLLRIDVSVADGDTRGFAIPSANPFIGRGRPEIWDVGLRNPWKFSFDSATGALLIADVGQNLYEEINYEPAGSGGRNYGWSLREGLHAFDPGKSAAFLPLDDPIHEYGHDVGRSVSGGYVSRGRALGSAYDGRYFFADFVTSRVWSMAVTPSGGGAIASDLREHTADLGDIGTVSSFGVDAAGDLYIVSYSHGRVFRLTATGSILTLDSVTARPGAVEIAGWAIDRRSASGSGIDTVHVYAFASLSSPSPPAPVFLGAFNAPFESRPDVAAVYGAQFVSSGFHIRSSQFFVPGPVLIAAYGRSVVTGQFEAVATRLTTLDTTQVAFFQDRTPTGSVRMPAVYSGWALDMSVASAPPQYGTGISEVSLDVLSMPGGQLAQRLQATYGLSRPDVAAIFGARFMSSGFNATLRDLAPGSYQLRVRYRLTASGEERWFDSSAFTVVPGTLLAVGVPSNGARVTSRFLIGGWTLDPSASAGIGVDAVHVWAYPNPGSGTPPIFLGAAQMAVSRPDVAALFGSQFLNAGFNLVAGPVSPGTYDVVVFARSSATLTFDTYSVVRVIVQ